MLVRKWTHFFDRIISSEANFDILAQFISLQDEDDHKIWFQQARCHT